MRHIGTRLALAAALAGGVVPSALAQVTPRAPLADSLLLVTLGAQEQAVPIYVHVRYEESAPTLPPGTLLGLLQDAVRARRGASTRFVPASEMPGSDRSWASLRVTVHDHGLTWMERESCVARDGSTRNLRTVADGQLWTHEPASVRETVGRLVEKVAMPRCGAEVGTNAPGYQTPPAAALPPGGTGRVEGMAAVMTPGRGVEEGKVDSLVVRPALVRLRVGESRPREELFTITGYRKGEAVAVVPFTISKKPAVARLWGGALVGVAEGKTVVEVGQVIHREGETAPVFTKVLARVTVEVVP